jgi:hypothetical protein
LTTKESSEIAQKSRYEKRFSSSSSYGVRSCSIQSMRSNNSGTIYKRSKKKSKNMASKNGKKSLNFNNISDSSGSSSPSKVPSPKGSSVSVNMEYKYKIQSPNAGTRLSKFANAATHKKRGPKQGLNDPNKKISSRQMENSDHQDIRKSRKKIHYTFDQDTDETFSDAKKSEPNEQIKFVSTRVMSVPIQLDNVTENINEEDKQKSDDKVSHHDHRDRSISFYFTSNMYVFYCCN